MLEQQSRSVCWKKWAAKHDYAELKEGLWLEPALVLQRRTTKEEWTEKHRNVARKFFLERGWVQKRLFDTGWSDKSKCEACHKEESPESTGSTTAQNGTKSDKKFETLSKKWEQKARTSKKE